MRTTEAISNTDNIIDSRDIIARISYLEDLASDDDEHNELKALQRLAVEASGCADWNYGETLIHDDYFESYARELADDIGAVPKDAAWPCTCIDWKQAAEELKQDYTSVDFDGATYWVRS